MAYMLPGLRSLLLLPLGALIACGSSTSPNAGFGAPTGDWILTVSPGTSGSATLAGALTVTGTSATGAFTYSSSTCPVLFNVSGAVVNNVLTLTSGSTSNGNLTAIIQLPLANNTNGTQTANGTVQIAGGSCAFSSAPLTATYLPSLTGTWVGTLTGPVNGTVTLAAAVGNANSAGQFPTSGTLSFSGATCTFSQSVTGLVTGYSLQLSDSRTTPDTVSLNTATSPATLTMSLAGGLTCPVGAYTGTVTRQ